MSFRYIERLLNEVLTEETIMKEVIDTYKSKKIFKYRTVRIPFLLLILFAILLIICTFVPYNHLNNSVFNENKRFTKHSTHLR